MMTTKDYSFFDPNIYANDFFTDPKKEPYCLRQFNKFWSQHNKTGLQLQLLEYGGGPIVSRIANACPYVKDIIFAEYLEANRNAVQAWVDNDPGAFNWRPTLEFIVQELEGKGLDEVAKREAELREKIRAIIPCDAKAKKLLEIPSSLPAEYRPPYDAVSTSLCLEVVVESEQEYKESVAQLAKLVKHGGYLIMHGDLHATYYTVGSKTFYAFPLTKELVTQSMEQAGLEDIQTDFASSDPILNAGEICSPFSDMKDVFFVHGRRA